MKQLGWKRLGWRWLGVLGCLGLLGVWRGQSLYWLGRSLWQRPGELEVRWEGIAHDRNLRDLGASLNSCLGEVWFREGLMLRANGWFSGWPCARVGDPAVILSLNYQPAVGRRFFCTHATGMLVGEVFNSRQKLHDLEFLSNWDPPTTADFCGFLRAGFAALVRGQKTLIHCDAGRDRTGTYAALLAGLSGEQAGLWGERLLGAIECDYRKTASLKPSKYGRMQRFLQAIRKESSLTDFLQARCGLVAGDLQAVAAAFAAPVGKS